MPQLQLPGPRILHPTHALGALLSGHSLHLARCCRRCHVLSGLHPSDGSTPWRGRTVMLAALLTATGRL